MWTGLPVEESIRMTEDRDKWRKYAPNPRIEDGYRTGTGTDIDRKPVGECVHPGAHALANGRTTRNHSASSFIYWTGESIKIAY